MYRRLGSCNKVKCIRIYFVVCFTLLCVYFCCGCRDCACEGVNDSSEELDLELVDFRSEHEQAGAEGNGQPPSPHSPLYTPPGFRRDGDRFVASTPESVTDAANLHIPVAARLTLLTPL